VSKNPLYKPPPNLINTIFFPKGGKKVKAKKRARGKLKGQNTYAGVEFGPEHQLPLYRHMDHFSESQAGGLDIARRNRMSSRLAARRVGRDKKAY